MTAYFCFNITVLFFVVEPWVHVAMAGTGGYIGYNLKTWEEEMLVTVNEKRVMKGLVPITRKSLEISSLLSNKEE